MSQYAENGRVANLSQNLVATLELLNERRDELGCCGLEIWVAREHLYSDARLFGAHRSEVHNLSFQRLKQFRELALQVWRHLSERLHRLAPNLPVNCLGV